MAQQLCQNGYGGRCPQEMSWFPWRQHKWPEQRAVQAVESGRSLRLCGCIHVKGGAHIKREQDTILWRHRRNMQANWPVEFDCPDREWHGQPLQVRLAHQDGQWGRGCLVNERKNSFKIDMEASQFGYNMFHATSVVNSRSCCMLWQRWNTSW